MGADAVTRTIKTVRAIPFMLRVLFPSKPAKWVSLSLRQPAFPGNRLFFDHRPELFHGSHILLASQSIHAPP